MGALDDLIEAVDTKLKTCSFISNTDNVVLGESVDIEGLGNSNFPRTETLIVKCKCNGYASQRDLQWSLRLATAAYFRTETDSFYPTLAELKQAIQYGKEVTDKYFSFLDDVQSGSSPCSGFEMIGDYPEIFFEKELIPKTMATIIYIELQLLLADTETLT